MSNKLHKKFVDLVLEGDALDTEIDDFVEQWHESDSKASLAEYLGFTEDEYALWVEQPETLRFMLFSRKKNVPLQEAIDLPEAHLLAARSQGNGDAAELLDWLRRTGRLPK